MLRKKNLFALPLYSKEQYELQQKASKEPYDFKDYGEWLRSVEEQRKLLEAQGFEAHWVAMNLQELQQWLEKRGLENNSKNLAVFLAEQLRLHKMQKKAPENIKKKFWKSVNEIDCAWGEFFKNRSRPKTDEEEKKEGAEFAFWYNNVYRQSDTGKTLAELGETGLIYSEDALENDFLLDEANELVRSGKHAQALPLCDELLEENPGSHGALMLKIEALIGTRKLSEAKKELEKARQLVPQDPYIHFHTATIFLREKNLEAAIAEIDRALQKEPENFDFLAMKAQSLALLGNIEYHECVKKLGLVDGPRWDNFVEHFWIDTKISAADAVNALNQIDFFLRNNQPEQALQEVRESESIPIKWKFREIIKGLEIEAYFQTKQIEKAKPAIQALLEKNPQNPHAYYYKANVELFEGNPALALQTINQCIAVAEKNNLKHFDYYSHKARILQAMKNPSYVEWDRKAEQLRNKK